MSKKKKHGERNQKLSDELHQGKVYFDWVITTAFYSAIHYVEDAILPSNVNKSHCRNINDVKKAYKMRGRHAARERLVFDKLPMAIGAKYKWLDDKSRYSRYTTFKITSTEADKAQQYLKEIYTACYEK